MSKPHSHLKPFSYNSTAALHARPRIFPLRTLCTANQIDEPL
jgi:hypothetical protein